MPSTDNVVSIWFGSAPSEAEYLEALDVSFSDDGDFLGSPLSNAIGVGYYEDSTREALYRVPGTYATEELLDGVSYQDEILQALGEEHSPAEEENCALLLYNYRFDGPVAPAASDGVTMRFVASVTYRHRG